MIQCSRGPRSRAASLDPISSTARRNRPGWRRRGLRRQRCSRLPQWPQRNRCPISSRCRRWLEGRSAPRPWNAGKPRRPKGGERSVAEQIFGGVGRALRARCCAGRRIDSCLCGRRPDVSRNSGTERECDCHPVLRHAPSRPGGAKVLPNRHALLISSFPSQDDHGPKTPITNAPIHREQTTQITPLTAIGAIPLLRSY
jgi:hypothetical protein